MSRVITATGMALLSIGIVTAVHAKPASQAGQVKVDEVAQAGGQSGEDDVATARSKGPKLRDKVDKVRHRGGPKGGGRDKILTGITEGPAPIDTTAEARRKEGPKGDVDHGVTEVDETAEAQPIERRKEGPKGAGGSDHQGQIEAPLLDDGPMAEKRRGPKERDKIDTGLTEAPSTDAARTGRPKERDKEVSTVTSRVSDPAASTDPQPVAKKRRGPKIKEKEATND